MARKTRARLNASLSYPSERRYRIPGDAPELPDGDDDEHEAESSYEGLSVRTGTMGRHGLIGGAGLQGIRSPRRTAHDDLPTIPTPNREGGFFRTGTATSSPIYDLGKIYARQQRDDAMAPANSLQALKAAKDLMPFANTDPEVARRMGQTFSALGEPEIGSMLSRQRAGAPPLPGGPPSIPGGPSLPPPGETYAQGLGALTTAFMRSGKSLREAAVTAKSIIDADPAWHAYREAYTAQERERAQLTARYDVQDEREPQLIGKKNEQEREDFRAATPAYVSRAGGQASAQQDAQNAGYGTRLARETQEMETRIPIKGRTAGAEQSARETAQTAGTIARRWGTKSVDLTMDPQIAADVEEAKNDPLKTRKQNEANIETAAGVVRQGNKAAIAHGALKQRIAVQLADFETRLKRTTTELKTRQAQRGGVTAGQQANKLAWQEATKVLSELDPDAAKELGSTPGEVLDALYSQFLNVAKKATMDPTALAVINRFGGK